MIGLVLTLVAVLGSVGALVAIAVHTSRAAKTQITAAQSLGTEVSALMGKPGQPLVPGESERLFGNRVFRVRYSAGGRNTAATLRLVLPIEPRIGGSRGERGTYRGTGRPRVGGQLAALFRKETPRDRFGKRIGLNREHQTGDDAFDRDVYIESDASPEDLQALLGDGATRSAVQQILGAGFESVALFAGERSVQAMLTPITSAGLARMEGVAGRLALIADNLPGFDRDPVGRATPIRALIAITFGMASALVLIFFAAVVVSQHPLVEPGVLGSCFLVGLVAWLAVSVAAFFGLRGRSDALRSFLFVFFTQVFAVPSLAVGLGAGLNTWLDTGAPVKHKAQVLAQWITTSKNGKTYHVRVASWRPDLRDVELNISDDVYQHTAPSFPIVVTTRPGWLGWEWVESVKRIAEP